MCVSVSVVLLALLVLGSTAAPAHEGCNLKAKATEKDLHKMTGSRWVLAEAFSNYSGGVQLLSAANSSIVEMSLNSDNKTFLFKERNIVNNLCLTYYVNMTIPDPETSEHSLHLVGPGVQDHNGTVTPYDDKGKADVYQTGPDSVFMIYSGVFNGTAGQMLLFYRQEGKHQNTEEPTAAQAAHEKMAECLGFTLSPHFIYDGKAGFCEKKTKDNEA